MAARITVEAIENRIIGHYANMSGERRSSFTPATNLKERFFFGPAEWAAEADRLSHLPWMKALEVRLSHSDMVAITTVRDLSHLIFSRARGVGGITRPKPRTRPKPKSK